MFLVAWCLFAVVAGCVTSICTDYCRRLQAAHVQLHTKRQIHRQGERRRPSIRPSPMPIRRLRSAVSRHVEAPPSVVTRGTTLTRTPLPATLCAVQAGSKASRKHNKDDRSASFDASKRIALEEMVQSYKEREERATGDAKHLREEARNAKLKNRALFDRQGRKLGGGTWIERRNDNGGSATPRTILNRVSTVSQILE